MILDVPAAKLIMDSKQYLETWILNFLSTPQSILNDFPPCPFAKKAYVDSRINIIEVTDYANDIKNHLSNWSEEYEVLVFVCPDNIDADAFVEETQKLNEVFMPKGLILLEDHVNIDEQIGSLILNNGKYNIILAQRIDKLNEAAEKLHRTAYYENWPKEYYDKVVGWRTLDT